MLIKLSGTKDERFVAVVDDEQSMREAVESLLRSAGHRCEGFASAEALLACPRLAAVACLVLDIGLPGMDGLELQQRLLHQRVPIVFITATTDLLPLRRTQALQAGAIAFLPKPFSEQELLDAVRVAVGI